MRKYAELTKEEGIELGNLIRQLYSDETEGKRSYTAVSRHILKDRNISISPTKVGVVLHEMKASIREAWEYHADPKPPKHCGEKSKTKRNSRYGDDIRNYIWDRYSIPDPDYGHMSHDRIALEVRRRFKVRIGDRTVGKIIRERIQSGMHP